MTELFTVKSANKQTKLLDSSQVQAIQAYDMTWLWSILLQTSIYPTFTNIYLKV